MSSLQVTYFTIGSNLSNSALKFANIETSAIHFKESIRHILFEESLTAHRQRIFNKTKSFLDKKFSRDAVDVGGLPLASGNGATAALGFCFCAEDLDRILAK